MIDKSIRQRYQDGEKVGPFRRGMEMIMPKLKEQALPQKGKKLPQFITTGLQRKALSKLGIGGLNPIISLLSLFGIDPIAWLSKKMTQGGVQQAYQAGFGSPQEGRELRQLEARRADMLQRKEEGRNYSERNLDIVTRAIAEAKGLDINNPNEMKNIDKPITQTRSVTEASQIIPETPDVISPHLEGEDEIMNQISDLVESGSTSQDTIDKINILATQLPFEHEGQIPFEHEGSISTTVPIKQDPYTGDAGIAERIAAENRAAATQAAATQAAAIQAENDRQQRERDAAAAAAARAHTAPVRTYSSPARPHEGGGGGGMGKGRDPGGGAAGSPFAKGGRVDKALGGRSRDI